MYLYEESGEKIELDTKYLEDLFDLLNKEYFNMKLPPCRIGTFSGKRVNTLGYFRIERVYIERWSRALYKIIYGERVYANPENFAEVCNPEIYLNANYRWTTQQMEATMLHEMCHYFTYLDGYAPKQGHGPEFRRIAEIVSRKSDGKFTIQRLANAEEMKELELDPRLKDAMKRKEENKNKRTDVILEYFASGRIFMARTSNEKMIFDKIKIMINSYERQLDKCNKVEIYRSPELVGYLSDLGYSVNTRGGAGASLRGWFITDKKDLLEKIYSYPCETIDLKEMAEVNRELAKVNSVLEGE